MEHRGRFQAQGRNLEESEPWAQQLPLFIERGLLLLDTLQGKLTVQDRDIRKVAFQRCRECIVDVSKKNGINITDMGKVFIKSFPKSRRERVDLEVRKGIAFIKEVK